MRSLSRSATVAQRRDEKNIFRAVTYQHPLPLVIRTALLRQYFGKQECWNSQRKSGSPASFVFGALAGHEDLRGPAAPALRDAEENYEL